MVSFGSQRSRCAHRVVLRVSIIFATCLRAPCSVMAQAPRAQMDADLSALFGRHVQKIRKTDEDPPRAAIIDVVMVITGQGAKNSASALARVAEQ